MAERPTGTVTFLFTDIEGSTRLLQALGADAYRRALDDHRRLLRAAFAEHDGYEVDTQGDAFFVAFRRATDALAAAADAQRALAAHRWTGDDPFRVRMGVHSTEAHASEAGYVGVGVHRGARICAAAHGGQVLLSQTTHDLLEGDATVALRDLGEQRLKDLSEPQRLYQLVIPEVPDAFPPPRTLGMGAATLPVQPTALVGREEEVSQVTQLLRRADVRLVTLTGAGGTGKTRLALEAAAGLADAFRDGVVFVNLAPVLAPELVVPTVAQALGINEGAGQSLSAYLATKQLLLVVDNCEQVVEAAPDLARLLGEAPGLKLVATSREPLRVAAEQVYPVRPLDPTEAVALFVARAQATEPTFVLAPENAAAVTEICARLDGLPLAVELAAARIAILSPEDMLRHLDKRLNLLTGGSRDLPARQQTVRDTLAWSHDLLGTDEQSLFAHLAVFAGGFSLEAAEAVCRAELDTLASLVAKSLVRHEGDRFEMLETIREYAQERLVAAADQTAVRLRHAEFFAALAEQAHVERFVAEDHWLEDLTREHDNLRGALDWFGQHDLTARLRLAGTLGWFWHLRSHYGEGRARLAEALAGTTTRDADRARALAGAGELAAWAGDIGQARPLIEEAVSIYTDLGRTQGVALALHELGWGFFYANEDLSARAAMEESLRLQEELGDPFLINRARIGLLQILVGMGELAAVEEMAPHALTVAEELGDHRSEHFAQHFLADCQLIRGNGAAAEPLYRRALELAIALGDRAETAIELEGVAMSAAGQGQFRRAVRLAGAAQAELDSLGINLAGMHFWTQLMDRYIGQARAELGSETESVWQAGRNLEPAQAIAEIDAPA